MIKEMSDNELLDMDYFLHEEDIDFGGECEEGFYRVYESFSVNKDLKGLL